MPCSLFIRCESGKYAVFFVYQMRVWKVCCVLCLSDASLESMLCSLFIRCESGKYAMFFVYQMRVWKVCCVLCLSDVSLESMPCSLFIRCESGKYAVFFVYQMRVWKVRCVLPACLGADGCKGREGVEAVEDGGAVHVATPPLPPLPAHQHPGALPQRHLPGTVTPLTTPSPSASRCTSSTPTRYSYTFNHTHTPPLPPLPAHQHPGALPQRHLPGTVTPLTTHTRQPYHHSQPISIPVHFLNDTYQVQLHF